MSPPSRSTTVFQVTCMPPSPSLLEFLQREARAHARAARQRRGEAHAVQAVVHAHLAVGEAERALRQVRQQRKREEAVRDGAAEGRAFRARRVDVDPLEVVDRLGEGVDALLRHLDPGRDADLLADAASSSGILISGRRAAGRTTRPLARRHAAAQRPTGRCGRARRSPPCTSPPAAGKPHRCGRSPRCAASTGRTGEARHSALPGQQARRSWQAWPRRASPPASKVPSHSGSPRPPDVCSCRLWHLRRVRLSQGKPSHAAPR